MKEKITISTIPHELLMLIVDLLSIGTAFSLSRVNTSLLSAVYKGCQDFFVIHDIRIDTICNGDTNLFKWLVPDVSLLQSEHVYKYCQQTADSGNLVILQYLHTNFPKNNWYWHTHICNYAAKNGHLEVLQYLHENGCPWDENTYYYAAKNGHLEIIKYMQSRSCENTCYWYLNKYACLGATENGHLEILQYLHENGCH